MMSCLWREPCDKCDKLFSGIDGVLGLFNVRRKGDLINDLRLWRFANVRGKSNRERQNRGKSLAASLFTKLSRVILTKNIFLKTFLTNGKR